MKLMHLADLHLGKRVNGFSMLEDQTYILDRICGMVEEHRPEAVVIAGDVYDRSVPSEEAVELLDDFLVRLAELGAAVLVIAGNHDSAERVAFGGRLLGASGIHMAPVYNGTITPVTLEDEYGPVRFWLIPFLKPAHVRRYAPEGDIVSYTDAMAAVVEGLGVNEGERNVALVHQFVTGGIKSDSEEHSVGGIDEVDGSVFDCFDYVALGHLHGPQRIGRDTVRYAGSPLKSPFPECAQRKSVTMVTLGEKGDVAVELLALKARRDLVKLRGTFAELTGPSRGGRDYYEITLLDEEDVPNAIGRLRAFYPNLMTLNYDNTRTRTSGDGLEGESAERKSPLELFEELYEKQNGQKLSDEQRAFLTGLVEEVWEVEQ